MTNQGRTPSERVRLHIACIQQLLSRINNHLAGILRELPQIQMTAIAKALWASFTAINIVRTIWNNFRAICFLLPAAIGFAFLADAIETMALLVADKNWLSRVGEVFASLSSLSVVHLSVFVLVAIGWPSLRRFGNFEFANAWKGLPAWGKLTAFLGISAAWFIGSAIAIT
tara:strand:- start:3348 stop:3860 length:513 start_codon:yes stop_codon:yes gene_type:complete